MSYEVKSETCVPDPGQLRTQTSTGRRKYSVRLEHSLGSYLIGIRAVELIVIGGGKIPHSI